MPYTGPSIRTNVLTGLTSNGIAGPSAVQLAGGIAQGLVSFLPTITVTTQHVGPSGSGTGTGQITLPASSGIPILKNALSSVNLNGPSTTQFATGVAQGVSREIQINAKVQVTIAGTAGGTGQGTLKGMSSTVFAPMLIGGFTANILFGSDVPKLAQALATGLINWFRTASVQTVDVGTPTVPAVPSMGIGTGKII